MRSLIVMRFFRRGWRAAGNFQYDSPMSRVRPDCALHDRSEGAARAGFTLIEFITRLRSCFAALRRSFAGQVVIRQSAQRPGFTLIEFIIVIAMIAIVASAVFVAIDPGRRLRDARNASRWTDTRAVLEAVKTYQVDHEGSLPSTPVGIDVDPRTVQMVGEGGVSCGALGGLCPGVTFPVQNCFTTGLDTDLLPYLKRMPKDPKGGSKADTRYYVNRDEQGAIVVGACNEEGGTREGEDPAPMIETSR